MDEERRAAFDGLVRLRSGALLRTAYLLTGDRALAEDLLQTALAKAYLRWTGLRDVGAGETYVRRVMATTYGKWWRRRWRGEIPGAPADDPLVADHADDAALRETVARALATLPAAQRVVVVLRFFDDLSEREVADLLGLPAGTVKSRTARALAALRGSGLLDETYQGVSRGSPACCATPEEAARGVVVVAHSAAMRSSSALRSTTSTAARDGRDPRDTPIPSTAPCEGLA